MVALGMTRYWRAEDGLRLDAGAFVRALEYAAGRTAVVVGKPDPTFYATAVDALGLEAGQVVMVGDDIHTDVEGAQRAGLTGVLVRTGKFSASDLERRASALTRCSTRWPTCRGGGPSPDLSRRGICPAQGMWGSGQVWPVALSMSAARSTRTVRGRTSATAFTTVVSLLPWALVATETCGTHWPAT